jgi:hypothetical protein
MLLREDYDTFDNSTSFDLLEFIVLWMNEVEELSKHERWSSDDKLDFVLNKISNLLSPVEYIKNEKLLIIVINGLIKMGNGEYRIVTNPHKNKSCCCCIL